MHILGHRKLLNPAAHAAGGQWWLPRGFEPSATHVRVEGYAPGGAVLAVEERGAWSGEVRRTQHVVPGLFRLHRALRLPQATGERQVVMTLTGPNGPADVRSVLLTPAEFSSQEWVSTGLGLQPRSVFGDFVGVACGTRGRVPRSQARVDVSGGQRTC